MKYSFVAALAAAVFALGAAPSGADVVDDARLRGANAETSDWLTHGHSYDNQRFSTLDQINRSNVARLVPKWIYQTGVSATFQATPLVADGVMYLTTPYNHVVALDAATGTRLWRYRHKMTVEKLCCGPANRGAAMGYGKVFTASGDGRLIALDRETGAVVWDVVVAKPDTRPTETVDQLAEDDEFRNAQVSGSSGLGANMAPLVFDGLVIVGVTGAGYGLHVDNRSDSSELEAVIGIEGKFGRRGYLAAFDAETGEEVWRWYTTAAEGWEGEWRTTTPDGEPLYRDIAAEKGAFPTYADAWVEGGGSTWTTPALDPELGLLYLGTGNPSPQMDDVSRPGDNLYTVSLVALDVRTGEIRWHFQQVPHDLWGYDVGSPPVLFDHSANGRIVPAVGQAGKTGWFYVHDRVTGALLYKSEPFVPHDNMFARPTAEGVRVAPGAGGGASWSPVAYDAGTGLAYVAAMHMPTDYTVRVRPAQGGQPALRYSVLQVADVPRWGTLSAIDTRADGRIEWQVRTDSILIGGVLATAGGLVFMGEGEGYLNAYDSATGARRWRFQCGAGVNAPPITYSVAGVQYVVVAAGGHHLFGFPQGDALIAFALLP
ncbi:MAG: PQQ-binding-like beta-propeller repeat protein [Alphaproteobacteria bacterium]|jgi:glucose dehydrogenase|nr:PQQ-binding-like beta-propeller repeat protein [Alphaproteobacteria bacterium]